MGKNSSTCTPVTTALKTVNANKKGLQPTLGRSQIGPGLRTLLDAHP